MRKLKYNDNKIFYDILDNYETVCGEYFTDINHITKFKYKDDEYQVFKYDIELLSLLEKQQMIFDIIIYRCVDIKLLKSSQTVEEYNMNKRNRYILSNEEYILIKDLINNWKTYLK